MPTWVGHSSRLIPWAKPARAIINLNLSFAIFGSLNILSQILAQVGWKGMGLKGDRWREVMAKEEGDGYPSWYPEKRNGKSFPYQNLFAHIIGGLNVSGWFSMVKCKSNLFWYSIACMIPDSEDRYFLEMNYVDESQISPNQASGLMRSWISIPMEPWAMRILPIYRYHQCSQLSRPDARAQASYRPVHGVRLL